MKHLIIAAAVLFLAAYSTSFAQAGAGVDVQFNASANVLSSLSVTNTDDLEFRNVIQGANKSVGADVTSGVVTATYGDGQLADFAITGTASKEVGAYITNSNDLVDGASNSLTITNFVGYANATNSLSGATETTDPTSWSNRINVTLDASGDGYMWIGATVQPAGSQAAGAYNGTQTLTFYYTGN